MSPRGMLARFATVLTSGCTIANKNWKENLMLRISRLLLSTLPLLLFGSVTESGEFLRVADDRIWEGIVCNNPEEAFAVVYDVYEGNGINGNCKRSTFSSGLRVTTDIQAPYPAKFYDLGDQTAVRIGG